MTHPSDPSIRQYVDDLYRDESARVLATLIRLLGDFDLAEEALHDAFAAAVSQWPAQGVPDNPRAWLVSAGRFRAIDAIRRRARFDHNLDDLAERLESDTPDPAMLAEDRVKDDHLRLIFTCCHPALSDDARIALTLRTVCGLTTEEIASAYLSAVPTMAQRIVRAKAKIRDARIPYELPSTESLPERLEAVLRVIYLVFNEGYAATSGDSLTRVDLTREAIRLARRLCELHPDPEVRGLLALMLLQDARREARLSPSGDLVLLEDQDRELWDREQIDEGVRLIDAVLDAGEIGSYGLQAAIAAVHSRSPRFDATDWSQIVNLYDVLLRVEGSPVVELNRAVALAMRDGPRSGLDAVEAIVSRGALSDYQPVHAARADLFRRLGCREEARAAYRRALELTTEATQRRYIEARLAALAD